MGPVGGGDDNQLLDPVREQLAEGQGDHPAVGTTDEGRDDRIADLLEDQSEQPGLVMGGDGDRLRAVGGLRRIVEGQDLEAAQIDRPADRDRARPPAQAVGLGPVHEPPRRDAAGHDHQRRPGPAVQPPDDLALAQSLAGLEAEVDRDVDGDIDRTAALAGKDRSRARCRATDGFCGNLLSVESHGVVCIVPPSKAPDALTDRGDVASSTLHSSLAEGPKTVLAGVGTVRLETDGCPDVKGPIPRSVLMSDFTLQMRRAPVKRKNLPHCPCRTGAL